MKLVKRVLIMVLVLSLLTGMVPTSVLAVDDAAVDNSVASVDNGDLTIEGTNGFGNLLSEEIAEQQEAASEGASSGYTVTALEIEGNVATVTYDSLEEATLVVALYTEDGLQMLLSGSTTVLPEETTATITLEGDMPQYFLASAYLLDSYDMSPLCPSYDTPLYTKEMQELLASTVDDYDADRVLNLDEDNTTNFAVYAEDTIVIEPSEDVNTVTSVDEGTMTYVIENVDSTITGFKTGDVFAYPYGDGEILIVKVATITVDGTTATITGAELEMEEAFSQVKIEGDGNTEELTVDDSTAEEGIVYEGIIQDGLARRAVSNSWSHSFNINIVAEKQADEFYISGSIKGGLKLKLTTEIDYYITLTRQYIHFKATPSIDLSVALAGNISGKIPMGKFGIDLIPGVLYVGFAPKLMWRFTGQLEFGASFTATIGVAYDSKTGTENLSTKPIVDLDFDVEGSVFCGIDLAPTVDVGKGLLATLKLSVPIGFKLTAEMTGTDHEDYKVPQDQLHTCRDCLWMTITSEAKIDFVFKPLKQDWLTVKLELKKWTNKLGNMYYSFDHKEFGYNECPYKSFRVTVSVVDSSGKALSGLEVKTGTGTVLGVTNANGVLVCYLPAGNVVLSTVYGNSSYTHSLTVKEACSTTFRVNGKTNTSLLTNPSDIRDNSQAVASGKAGQFVTWSLSSDGYLYIGGKGSMTNYSGGNQVPWYSYKSKIKHVVIDNGVISIGDYAFYECNNLTGIAIPNSVTTIGSYAFSGCESITSVKIPSSATNIGTYVFEGCYDLAYVSIPNNWIYMPEYMFANCMSLRSVTLPSSLKEIGTGSFGGCLNLSEVNLPSNLTYIGVGAFSDCALSNVVIPGSVQRIDTLAFSSCEDMNYLTISSGVKYIGEACFAGCTSMRNVTIPDSVTSLGDYAFEHCFAMTEVEIPGKLNYFGVSAFAECDALTTVTFREGLTSIPSEAFRGCDSLAYISFPNSLTYIGESAFCMCNGLVNVTIPANIGRYAFASCENLKNVVIQNGVTSIGYGAFDSCYGLETISIPDSVTTIEENAFGVSGLVHITIPGSVTEIPDYAFTACQNLISVVILDGVQSIGNTAFAGCESLTELVLPNSITSIGKNAFNGCDSLTSVTIPRGVTSIGLHAFSNLTNIVVVEDNTAYSTDDYGILYNKDKTVLIQAPGTITELTISDSVTSIGDYALASCKNLTSITLPNGLTSIGNWAFNWCENLNSITIPNGVISIGDYAFASCKTLTSITLSNSLTSIGECAFDWCEKLSNITIPDSMTGIGSRAFDYCTGLTSITMPNSIISIDYRAFYSCKNLTSIIIPVSVKSIGDNVFGYCTRLKTIYFMGNAPSFDDYIFNGVTATAYYPTNDSTWTADIRQNYGGTITWVPYTPESAVELCDSGKTVLGEMSSEISQSNAVFGGEYNTEVKETYTLKTAAFSDLVPGEEYVLLSLASLEVDEPLAAENLLYIDQAVAGEDGTLSFQYVQRMDTAVSYVMVCGASNKDLEDATITFPEMRADGETALVAPVVTYDGKVLTENVDYVIVGDVDYTEPGEYTCHIRGIYNYTGLVSCTYKVYMEGPTLTLKNPTLAFEDEILYNVYFNADDLTSVVEMGLVTFADRNYEGTMDDALEVIPGYVSNADGTYTASTNGIPAKMLGDAVFFKVYAKLSDGSYVYSDVVGYHAVAYANTVLNSNSSAKAKALVVAMLNYGAAAQVNFNYKTDSLMNASLTADQLALVEAYSETMVAEVPAVGAKAGQFVMNGGYTDIHPTVSFEGAFSINYYFTPKYTPDNGVVNFYYWSYDAFNAAEVLTPENATGTVQMTSDGAVYTNPIQGIAAKQIDEPVYVAGLYTNGGTSYYTPVIGYSLGAYCKNIAQGGNAFGTATAVYGFYAKAYFVH